MLPIRKLSALLWLALAACASPPPAAREAPRLAGACLDGLPLSAAECKRVRELALPEGLPEAAGNRFADDEAAAYFGFLAFYDRRFSSVADVSCASCHLPESSFADGKRVSEVVAGRPLTRNAPTLLNAARMGPFWFWDGRADSLWSQPLFALENPDEMASSRLQLAHAVYASPVYRERYEALAGPLPDMQRFPAAGKPGDRVYDAMSAADRRAIDTVAANVGKLLEAYLRKMTAGKSKLDAYLAGDRTALGPGEKAGLLRFVERGCIECHAGPMLSDARYHRVADASDRGRAAGLEILLHNPFNSRGEFYDRGHASPPQLPAAAAAEDEYAFRTPSLRNVALTAPYGHAGQFATLRDLLASSHGAALSEPEQADLELFLLTLNGAYPDRPWSDWPAR
ncbi:MAG TPA: cytochrome c peroxidase [Polyangiales bacterium]|nr:cytochrome c peroxidase [Polyangiales bacterium]